MDVYTTLDPPAKLVFRGQLRSHLAQVLDNCPRTNVSDFVASFLEAFRKAQESVPTGEDTATTEKKGDRMKKSNTGSAKVKPKGKAREPKQARITDYQIFEKAQLKARSDEFKGVSRKDRKTRLTHEWFQMSQEEREHVIANTGRLRV